MSQAELRGDVDLRTFEASARVDKAFLKEAGDIVVREILDNTDAGRDFRGAPFAPYSPNGPVTFKIQGLSVKRGGGLTFKNYATMKQAFGHSNVDMIGLGEGPHMIDQMKVVPNEAAQEVRIVIDDPRAVKIAKGHISDNRPKGMPKREWFGFTSKSIFAIRKLLRLNA